MKPRLAIQPGSPAPGREPEPIETLYSQHLSQVKRWARMARMWKPSAAWFQVVFGVTSGRYSSTLSFWPSTLTVVFGPAFTLRSTMSFHSPNFQRSFSFTMT